MLFSVPAISASFWGALLLSSLGDRLGRRRLIVFGVMLFSVCTLAAGHGTTLIALSVLRFGAGIGLGGAVPNAIALTAEYAPHKNRASRITLLYVAYTVGGAGAGLLASWLIPKWGVAHRLHGWRLGWPVDRGVALFLFAGIAVFSVAASASRPGAATDRWADASRSAAPAGDADCNRLKRRRRGVPFMALFQEGRTAVTLLLWFSYVMGIMALQFITSWLPTLIAGTGVSISLAVLIGSLFHIGGTAGNIVVGFLMDRRGIKTIAIGFLIAVPITACMGLVSATLPLLALATLCAGVLIVGSLNGINAVSGMVYPTGMRATGAGWMNGVGRLGSIIGPVLGGILISLDMPISTLFLCLAVPVGDDRDRHGRSCLRNGTRERLGGGRIRGGMKRLGLRRFTETMRGRDPGACGTDAHLRRVTVSINANPLMPAAAKPVGPVQCIGTVARSDEACALRIPCP